MTQAYLQHQAHQLEQCLATLTELRALAPKHRQLLKLLSQTYQELRDWTGLVDLIPDLRQNYALTTKEIDTLELTAHQALLKLTLPSRSPGVLNRAWNSVPKNLRRDPTLIAIYAQQLIQQDEMNEAETLLRGAIESNWSSSLVELYGQVRADNPDEQLETAEGWLSTHADDVKLLLALAKLAQRSGQENKARVFLEKCLALHGPAEAYRELGHLLERLGDKDKALSYYRRGLEMQTDDPRTAPGHRTGTSVSRNRTSR